MQTSLSIYMSSGCLCKRMCLYSSLAIDVIGSTQDSVPSHAGTMTVSYPLVSVNTTLCIVSYAFCFA